jgi:hypothetical protein
VTIYCAGAVATEIICKKHGWAYEVLQEGDRADREAIDRWCREVLNDSEQSSRVKEDCLVQARNILTRSIEAVDALAVVLVVQGQIAGGEAHRIIRHALGETGADWRLAAWGL